MKILVKYFIINLFGLLLWNYAYSQVFVTIMQSSPLNAKVSDLFNGSVNNTTANTLSLYFIGSIVDVSSGKELVKAKSIFIDFNPGFTQLSESILLPTISYNNTTVQQSGMLPFGNFRYCLKAYQKGQSEPMEEACIDVDNIPMSPPLLLSPSNKEEIHFLNPMLIWVAASPFNPKLQVLYDLKLVEMMQNQTVYDAVERNLGVFEASNIKTTAIQYPANAINLEEGKMYAWKVIAKSTEGNIIGHTETWSFTIKLPKDTLYNEPKRNRSFIKLNTNANEEFVTVKNELKLLYEERYGKSIVTISIKDMSNKELYSQEINVVKGENPIVINLKDIGTLKDKTLYLIQASSPGKIIQQLTIKNIK